MEIKIGATFQKDYIKNIKYFLKLESKAKGYLIYNGECQDSHLGIRLANLKEIPDIA